MVMEEEVMVGHQCLIYLEMMEEVEDGEPPGTVHHSQQLPTRATARGHHSRRYMATK
jgi:hypothetical protein